MAENKPCPFCGSNVRVVDNPISLLKKHAGIKGEIIKKGFGYEWLVNLDGELWWAKGYDIAGGMSNGRK